jgi:hypothetical protein
MRRWTTATAASDDHLDGVEMSRYLYRLATDPLDQQAKSYTYCAGPGSPAALPA